MKKQLFFYLLVPFILVLAACNNAGVETKASPDTRHTSTELTEKEVPKSCCFSDNEEVAQFFPPGTASLPVANNGVLSGTLACTDDGTSESGLSKTYLTKKGRLLLKISDYCMNPRRLELDYKRRYVNTLKVYGDDQQVQEIADPAGLYKGFAIFSAKNKSSYLVVIVDDRFGITITGVEQDNMSDITSLFNSIPTNQLAIYKKP